MNKLQHPLRILEKSKYASPDLEHSRRPSSQGLPSLPSWQKGQPTQEGLHPRS